jgi:hypothetical protein
MATAFDETVPKYGRQCKSCSLKCAAKFQQKCWQNRTAYFVPSTICWRLCSLRKLVGEIDTRTIKNKTRTAAIHCHINFMMNLLFTLKSFYYDDF